MSCLARAELFPGGNVGVPHWGKPDAPIVAGKGQQADTCLSTSLFWATG